MKLYTRKEIKEMEHLLFGLLQSLLKIMKENIDTIMPGFTHLQKAQPITLAHHMGAYFEMFYRDRSRLQDIHKRMNYCPSAPVHLPEQPIRSIVNAPQNCLDLPVQR